MLNNFRSATTPENEMLSNRMGPSLALSGMYRNQDVFLISDQGLNEQIKPSSQKKRGICFAAYNSGIHSIHPHLWFCDEKPAVGDLSYWLDPTIVKLVPQNHLPMVIAENATCQEEPLLVQECPAIFSYGDLGEKTLKFASSEHGYPTPPPNTIILALLDELGFNAVIWLPKVDRSVSINSIKANRFNLHSKIVELESVSWLETIESHTQHFHNLDTRGMYDGDQRKYASKKTSPSIVTDNSQKQIQLMP